MSESGRRAQLDLVLDGALASPIVVGQHPQERPWLGSELALTKEQVKCVLALVGRFGTTSTLLQRHIRFHDGVHGNSETFHVPTHAQ